MEDETLQKHEKILTRVLDKLTSNFESMDANIDINDVNPRNLAVLAEQIWIKPTQKYFNMGFDIALRSTRS